MLGVLCAQELGADRVITPVSSNSVVEKCGAFARVVRTRIGSPYVIAAIEAERLCWTPAVGAHWAQLDAALGAPRLTLD